MKTIGDRLKQFREEAELAQEDIAEILGIQLPDYIGIENNKVDLTLKHIETLRKKFHISIDWLITGVEIKYNIDNFGEDEKHIKMMLHDMEIYPALRYNILSHYYGIKLLYTPKPPNRPFVA